MHLVHHTEQVPPQRVQAFQEQMQAPPETEIKKFNATGEKIKATKFNEKKKNQNHCPNCNIEITSDKGNTC